MDLLNIPPGKKIPDKIYVVIEIPKGSRNKYEYNTKLRAIKLNRVLYSAVSYPGEYGFIPSTISADGDPLDVLVISEEPTFPGCIIECKPIGVLKLLDRGQIDDKIIAIPRGEPRLNEIKDIRDLPKYKLKEIEEFFKTYKKLEGKNVQVKSWNSLDYAKKEITNAVKRFKGD
ncbi:MAG: inorganic diphosphatase [Candidatus Diapherotrites archaeon]|nr:inorganic diphosphatase [Candidatus Diapherotrites archaeon]